MDGRLEQENKIFQLIENKLKDMPQFIHAWYISLKASDNSAKTCRDYINKVNQYLQFVNHNIKSINVNDLNFENVSGFYISIKTKKDSNGNLSSTSDSYQQSMWCCLNNLFTFLHCHSYIRENYMLLIKKPKNKDLVRINNNRLLLQEKDFKSILETVQKGCGTQKSISFQNKMRDRDTAIMLIFMTTGIRKSALSEINITNIDFDNSTLFIQDKGDVWHHYQLTEQTMSYINKWLEKRELMQINNTDALFISYQGNRMSGNSIYKLVDKYCDGALGYHISPHKLRSGFCSIMYHQTGDIEKVRRIVGHSNVATTQRYIVTNNQETKEASDIMNKIFI